MKYPPWRMGSYYRDGSRSVVHMKMVARVRSPKPSSTLTYLLGYIYSPPRHVLRLLAGANGAFLPELSISATGQHKKATPHNSAGAISLIHLAPEPAHTHCTCVTLPAACVRAKTRQRAPPPHYDRAAQGKASAPFDLYLVIHVETKLLLRYSWQNYGRYHGALCGVWSTEGEHSQLLLYMPRCVHAKFRYHSLLSHPVEGLAGFGPKIL